MALSTLHSCSLSSTSLPHLRLSHLRCCDAAAAASGGSIRCLSSSSPTPPTTAFSPEDLKKLAAAKAVKYVKSGMVLGLGTGITAGFVVAEIGALLSAGKLRGIVGVPTSKRTFELAKSAGIPLSTLDEHPWLDLAIDGADEVDPDLNLVKGRGGALLREKMVEAASAKFLVVGDESKLVTNLGGSGLAVPVEVVQFCWKYNQTRLQGLFKDEGCAANLRLDADGKPYVTDNSNYIVDLYFKTPINDLNAAGIEISALEGVVEHGFFLDMANEVIIAGKEGLSIKTNLAAMVKAGKWLRNVLTGKKEKNKEKEMEGRIWLHLSQPPPTPLTSPEDKKSRCFQLEMEKQNPAVQFALPPANCSWFEPELEVRRHSKALTSAAEVEDYVGRGAARKACFSTIEDVAAIMIQASFRSLLARKALRALKGLVKLQAVVRGFLVRKQAAATLRSMQALLIAQARARARRVRMVEEVDATPCRESSQRRLMGEFNFQQLLDMDRTVDMIVEMDKGQSKGNSKSRKISNPITQSETISYQKFSSDPSASTDMSSCNSSTAARCSFHYSSPSHKPGRMRSPDKIIMQEDSYLMSHEFPSYMANTESRRAKARSQSAPRQRHEAFDQKQSCKENTSFGGRNSKRAAWVQQSSMSLAVGSTAAANSSHRSDSMVRRA